MRVFHATDARPFVTLATALLIFLGGGNADVHAAPDIVGNFLSTNRLTFWNDYLEIEGFADYPALGRINLADNNSPLPQDRCFFVYNQYNNILDRSVDSFTATPLDRTRQSLDRYMFGGERTFSDGLWSLEARMPFFASTDWLSSSGVGGSNPALGNLAIIFKSLFYRVDTFAVSTGLGVSPPTGDDVQFTFANQAFTVHNDAVNLQPFVAFLAEPNDRFFSQGFLQLNVPTGGNEIQFRDLAAGGAAVSMGKLTDQTVLLLNLNSGYWFYRNQQSDRITGIAALLELHYTTALENTDVVGGTRNGAIGTTGFAFDDSRNRFDFVSMAFGIHTEIANRTAIRVAGIVPLSNGDNNFFDSEIFVSINRSF